EDREVQPQPLQANLGTSYKMDLGGGLHYTLSADIRNLEQQLEFMRRVRLGVEIGLTPAFSALAGFNSGHYSYGIKFNTGLLKFYLGFFDQEIGEKLGQQKSERFLVYFSLFDFTFDG